MRKTAEAAKILLADEKKLKEFSLEFGVTLDMARALLEHLLKDPDITDATVEAFIAKSENPELKAFYAGEKSGFKQGHSSGMGKGIAAGVLLGLLLGGVAYAASR